MFVNANNIAELIWYLFFLWCLWLYIPPWPEWPLWVGSWKTHDVILTVYSLDCIRTPWLCTAPLTVYCPLDCRVTSCLWPILWPVWVGSGNPHDVILTVKWLHSIYLTTARRGTLPRTWWGYRSVCHSTSNYKFNSNKIPFLKTINKMKLQFAGKMNCVIFRWYWISPLCLVHLSVNMSLYKPVIRNKCLNINYWTVLVIITSIRFNKFFWKTTCIILLYFLYNRFPHMGRLGHCCCHSPVYQAIPFKSKTLLRM